MEPQDLPSDFETEQVYSGVKRIPISNSEDQGVLYRGKGGSHSIIIRQNFDNADAHSPSRCVRNTKAYIFSQAWNVFLLKKYFFLFMRNTLRLINGCKTKKILSNMINLLINLYKFYDKLNMSFFKKIF